MNAPQRFRRTQFQAEKRSEEQSVCVCLCAPETDFPYAIHD